MKVIIEATNDLLIENANNSDNCDCTVDTSTCFNAC